PSWKVKLGHFQTRIKGEELRSLGFVGGYGYSYHFKYFAPYVLAHGESAYVSEKSHKLKLAYGADIGALVDFNSHFKYHTSLKLRAYPWQESSWLNELRYTSQRYGVGGYQTSYLLDGVQELGFRV